MSAPEQPAKPVVLERKAERGGGKGSGRRRVAQPRNGHAGRRAAIAALFVLIVVAISPHRAASPPLYEEGSFATESVMAEVAFTVEDLAATENARRRAANAAPYVFRVDEALVQERLAKLQSVFAQVEQIAEKDVLSPDERRRLAAISIRPTLSDATMGLLIQPENVALIRDQALKLARTQLERGIFDDQPLLASRVQLTRPGGTVVERGRDDVRRLAGASRLLEEACRAEAGENTVMAATLYEVAGIALGPTVRFDEAGTQALQAAARAATPAAMRTIHRNELIVQAGHQVTQQDVQELLAYSKTLQRGGQVQLYVGNALSVFVLMLAAIALLRLVRKDIFASGRLVWLLTLPPLLIVGVARVLVEAGLGPEFRVLVPVAACAIMLTILLDWMVGIGVALFAALAVTCMPEYGPLFLLQAFVSTVLGVTTMGRVRKRSDLLRPSVVVGLACAMLIIANGLVQDAGPRTLAVAAGLGLGNGLIIAVIVPGLLAPMERIGGVTSDITLLEYCDLKHPLLVRMQQEAPGTFHHSLTMATLSEAAAEAIGANPLLARVGCYFHDIGKMVKPEYFSENQHGVNAHDAISPRMSALILNAHVKEGIALGRKHGLTDAIVGFIPEHQGSAIMVHFYKKALEQAGADERVNESDFRYAGPRPQSKETAICMIADGVEAASRTLDNPTPTRIQSMVYKIANNKFLDGQLDDCDLTLRDLNKICEAFTRVLSGMLHGRVAYPEEQTAAEIKDKVAGSHSQSQPAQGIPVPASAPRA